MLTNFSQSCVQSTVVSDLITGTGYPGLKYATYAFLLSIFNSTYSLYSGDEGTFLALEKVSKNSY